jgi:transposase
MRSNRHTAFDPEPSKYRGGRPPKFTLVQRREIKKVARTRLGDRGLPFSTWSRSRMAEFLVAEGWSTTSATRACVCCSGRRASPLSG